MVELSAERHFQFTSITTEKAEAILELQLLEQKSRKLIYSRTIAFPLQVRCAILRTLSDLVLSMD